MQPELKRELEKRARNLGCVLLAILAVMHLAAAYLAYPLLDRPSFRNEELLGAACIGAILAGFLAATLWATLSLDNPWRRFAFFAGASTLTLALWMAGICWTLDDWATLGVELQPKLAALNILPTAIAGIAGPLLLFRWLSGYRLQSKWTAAATKSKSRSISILDMMLIILLTAIVMWSIKMIAGEVDSVSVAARSLTFVFAASVVTGLGIVLPTAIALSTPRIHFLVAAFVVFVSIMATGVGASLFLQGNERYMMLTMTLATATMYPAWVGGIRLLGFQLKKLEP